MMRRPVPHRRVLAYYGALSVASGALLGYAWTLVDHAMVSVASVGVGVNMLAVFDLLRHPDDVSAKAMEVSEDEAKWRSYLEGKT